MRASVAGVMAITTISAFTRVFNALWANRNAPAALIFRPTATDETRRRWPVGKAVSRLVFHVFRLVLQCEGFGNHAPSCRSVHSRPLPN
jgi:hypothetical protein